MTPLMIGQKSHFEEWHSCLRFELIVKDSISMRPWVGAIFAVTRKLASKYSRELPQSSGYCGYFLHVRI